MTAEPVLIATPVLTGAESLGMLAQFAMAADEAGFDILRLLPLPGFDPLSGAAALVPFTRRIVLCAGAPTGIGEPYTLARGFAALDHLSGGRAGWEVIIGEPAGLPSFPIRQTPGDHEARAEEFVEAAFALWDSWAPDAILFDKTEARFSDPSRIRRIDFDGRYIHSRGPLNTPRPPQGRPIILGQSAAPSWLDADVRLGPGATEVRLPVMEWRKLMGCGGTIPSTDGSARQRLRLPLRETWS